MKQLSMKEEGNKAYLIEHTSTGDVVDLVVPLPEKSGGGGTQPGPNTVGTDEIVDGSVNLEDLNNEVTDKLVDRVTADELDNFDV